ncbi:HAD family phosphatase [Sulfuriflexus sp.]|uniref:HAD family hydrolase n=1 Tax=Sulfuriflexus sp. TaxID=2015443 RepID=UPI0028CF3554|nr:HAD family phosphatase [Sulfuriflexus sp.]MDT8404732.1 HAD family phosphatase [Sulfuriflexus sp.]
MPGENVLPTHIRAVLLDFGGVIAEEGFQNGLHYLAETQQLDADEVMDAGREAVYDSGYVTGTGSEADFWALLRQRTGITGDDEHLTRDILDRFIIRPWVIEYVRRLHAAGFITAILSDQTDWLERLDKQFHFTDDFDQIFNSYRLGKSKRDPGLFDDVIKALGIMPGEALFIDDDASHVRRARDRGLWAIRFKTREDFHARLRALPRELAIPVD